MKTLDFLKRSAIFEIETFFQEDYLLGKKIKKMQKYLVI